MSTKQTLKNETIACGKNPNYFIKKYVKIRHPVRGLIPFGMFDYQEELVRSYLFKRFNVILKGRQMGISEVTAAYAAWLMMFHKDKNILVIATKAETAKNLVKKVRTALTKLPKWLRLAEITVDNRMSLELSNGSVIKAVASSGDAGRSEALSLLIIDEAAFIKNMDELWTGLLPTVQAGGRVIVLSTPNGVGNIFHKLYTEADNAQNDFHPTRLMWWLHPERIYNLQDDPDRPGFKTSDWYKKETKNMSSRDIAQELECNFNASGDTVISHDLMVWVNSELRDPSYVENIDRKLYVWNKPVLGKKYLLSADVARGDGNDFSGFHVFEIGQMEQVAEYCSQVPVKEFAEVICRIGHEYNDCVVAIENVSIGLACLEHVKMIGYPNLYYSRKGDTKMGECVNTTFGVFSDDLVPGFTTSQKTRPLILSKLEEYIRNHAVTFRSRRVYSEFKTFIWNNGHAEAMKGYNDDLTMAGAIGVWLRDTFVTPNFAGIEMNKKMLASVSMNKVVNTDIRGASKDPRLVPRQVMGAFMASKNPYELRLSSGQVIDFRELLDGVPARKR